MVLLEKIIFVHLFRGSFLLLFLLENFLPKSTASPTHELLVACNVYEEVKVPTFVCCVAGMEPVLSHVSETFEGLATIRSLQRQHMFKDIFEARQVRGNEYSMSLNSLLVVIPSLRID